MKVIVILITILTLLLVTACQGIEGDIKPINSQPVKYLSSEVKRETDPIIDLTRLDRLAHDNNHFALAFYALIRNSEDNLIFSPFSLSLALSMALAGAEMSTEQAMLEALQLTLSESDVHPAINALVLAIEGSQITQAESEAGRFQLNLANAIWGQDGFDFRQDFLETLAHYYGAGIHTVDFAAKPESARKAINEWVAKETEDKIQDLIPPDAINTLTRLVLANAIYFNGSWMHPFDQTATRQGLFTKLDGTQMSVEMMNLFDKHLLYVRDGNLQAVRLPYLSDDFAMTILVPDSGTYSQVEDDLTASFLSDLTKKMILERVNLAMPKFDIETTINANAPLKSLGMEEAFDPDLANFTGMTNDDVLYITDVLQKATITVDEAGTEAAAATAVIMGLKSMPTGKPISVVIDRPFMFLIQHIPTGAILFMGRVMQP